MDRKILHSLLFLPCTIIYLELLTKLLCFGRLTFPGAVFGFLFSMAAGILLTGLCLLFGPRGFWGALLSAVCILSVLFAVQNVYHSIFNTFFSLSSASEAANVLSDFYHEALTGMARSWRRILVCFLPFMICLAMRKAFVFPAGKRRCIRVFCLFLLLHIAAAACVWINGNGVLSFRTLYRGDFTPELSARYFGILTMERQDIFQLFSGKTTLPAPSMPSSSPAPLPTTESDTPVSLAQPNTLDIDFSALAEAETDETLRRMHQHFASVEPTMKNEYTGLFEGKNLIWIVA